MKRSDLDAFEKIVGQLRAFYDELSILSKKSPNDAVNKFKLRFINACMDEATKFLGKKHRPFETFDRFNEDELPQNSDVVMILSQYLQCFEKWRAHTVERNTIGVWHWVIDAEPGDADADLDGKIRIRTAPHTTLRE